MVEPRVQPMTVLAFFNSTSTDGVLEAEVVVVKTFEELQSVDVSTSSTCKYHVVTTVVSAVKPGDGKCRV